MPPRSRPGHLQEALALYPDPGPVLARAGAQPACLPGPSPEDSPRTRLRALGAVGGVRRRGESIVPFPPGEVMPDLLQGDGPEDMGSPTRSPATPSSKASPSAS
ncbi:MAG: hypothetical protein AVDCRST_MAG12-3335 [uncultured Rubrobacteraceae bacterium]|uniref:Uncharacterized protein n=1 Tax=uncultured Rubrobacteraceae bacterium TaxID=349277 RepID=A0A6J4T4F4_9ACTN|nr:MAG: hypothetical protein AVDCRST_MAG12-3335 [uncultured Rubrobacteraceae bacterium]